MYSKKPGVRITRGFVQDDYCTHSISIQKFNVFTIKCCNECVRPCFLMGHPWLELFTSEMMMHVHRCYRCQTTWTMQIALLLTLYGTLQHSSSDQEGYILGKDDGSILLTILHSSGTSSSWFFTACSSNSRPSSVKCSWCAFSSSRSWVMLCRSQRGYSVTCWVLACM